MKFTPGGIVMGIILGGIAFLFPPYFSLMAPPLSQSQLPYFLLLNAIEAAAMGLAIAFLVSALPRNAIGQPGVGYTRLALVSLTWILGNWWLHDSLHVYAGDSLTYLLYIEYAFHITMIVAAGYLVYLVGKFRAGKKLMSATM